MSTVKVEIKSRWNSSQVLFSAEVSTDIEERFRMRAAVIMAIESNADLRAADLSDADLRDADLRAANLSDADLRAANLSAADLRDADLSAANLSAANLSDADLRAANLRDANLRAADLSDADLRAANLRDADLSAANLSAANLRAANLRDADLSAANLSAANLRAANLTPIRDDFWAVLSAVPREVAGLRAALIAGRVDGSTYQGECACLVGTIANVRGTPYDTLDLLRPNSSRPIEQFFMGISRGDTPATNQFSKLALEWLDQWVANMQSAFGCAEKA